jgi:hypothetical protein
MGSFIFGTVSITFVRRCLTPSPFPCLQAGVAALTQQTERGMVPSDSARLALGCQKCFNRPIARPNAEWITAHTLWWSRTRPHNADSWWII